MLTRLFLAVWRMSVQGAAAALVVFLAVLALRRLRAPRAVCCALWLAVLVRLLCPVGFTSAISIFNAPALGRCVETLQGEAAVPEAGAGLSGHSGADEPLPDGALFATDAAGLAQPVQPAAPDVSPAAGQQDPGTALTITPDAPDMAGTPALSLQAALPLLAALWLAGVLGMALYGFAGAARLRGRVALAFRVEGEAGVYTGEQIAEPFAFGLLRPRIYLPLGLAPEERRIILLHERAHLRRRDNLVKPLFYAALCLHWFNPLAWLAFRGMASDMEAACDEAVLRAAGSGVKAAYCQSLLRFSGPRPRAAVALNFGEGQISGRVRAILTWKRPAFWAGAAAALAAVLLAAACMADPIADRAAGGDGSPDGAPADEPPIQSMPAASEPADSLSAEESVWYSNDGLWLWPVPDYTIWAEAELEHHQDIIRTEAGQPILAMAAGRVQKIVADTDAGFSTIILEHPDGSRTEYGHCIGVLPAEGDEVEQGQQIAAAGLYSNTLTDGTRFNGYCLLALYLAGQDGPADLWTLFETLPGRENAVGPYAVPDGGEIPADPGFIWPVPDYEHVSRWMDSSHKGADILAENGTPILAAADGEVITAMYHFSYGNYLVIDHGGGWRTLYAHCESLLVQEGDRVEQGQQVAMVGATGNASGNICHFEIYLGSTRLSAKDFFPDARAAGEAANADGSNSMAEGKRTVYEGEAPADPGFAWPVPDYLAVTRWMSDYHYGTDIAAGSGTPVLAALDGEVVFAGYGTAENGYPGYGFVVVLLHEDGWMTSYSHCAELMVDQWDRVEQGQQIAAVGSTGSSTGNHCHFELTYNSQLVSARNYFDGM